MRRGLITRGGGGLRIFRPAASAAARLILARVPALRSPGIGA